MLEKIIEELRKDPENADCTEEELKEMAQWELQDRENNKRYEVADKPRKKSEKQRKPQVSNEKQMLFSEIWFDLYDVFRENAEILKENKLIQVKIGEKIFKIDVIEQRTPKN